MPVLSGAEIQGRLQKFAKRWKSYHGTERSEAQTFLNELFQAYGQDRLSAGALFENPQADGGIVDLLYPGVAIIEMKAPAETKRLEAHRKQALDYWHHSDDSEQERAAPPYVVLCSFHRFEVWEPGRFPSRPRDTFNLEELADRYEALLFLSGQQPLFLAHRRHLTTAAAERVALLNEALTERLAAEPADIRRFLLQSVWCLFAEGVGLLEHRPFTQIVQALLADPSRSSAAELGHLFAGLNMTPTQRSALGGAYADLPYVDGGLFAEPTRLHLTHGNLQTLTDVAGFEWREVDPTIFGALMEDCLGRHRRWELGAHYTYEADILRIVLPSIITPWTERILSTSSVSEAVQALEELCGPRILDPACGCGNFLYVAYREVRALEQRAKHHIADLCKAAGVHAPTVLPSFPISNLYGIEIDEFAVLIARMTLWMGHKLVTDAFGLVEPVLPLVDLSGIRAADALATEWPDSDVIIGNPPFHGSQHLRSALGNDYVDWLKRTFGCGIKDLCVYWFRKAADHLPPGGRAGLVGTNSISQNRARGASLDYVVQRGGVITSAISTEVWPGDAKVHVSIVNWVKDPLKPVAHFTLDERAVPGISSSLRPTDDSPSPVPLAANAGRCFQGPIPVGSGFILDSHEAEAILSAPEADYREVIRPYLIGEDIAEDTAQGPRRWIIDFVSMSLEEAQRFPRAIKIAEERVRPERQHNADPRFKRDWWLFGRPRGEMRDALRGLERYPAGTRVGKRLLLTWCDPVCLAGDSTNVFAFEDDYSFGILTSAAHLAWARRWSSTLKGDLRYTPSTVFTTFPWPSPLDDGRREAVAASAADLVSMRTALCADQDVGLTRLYNTMDAGGHRALHELHRRLDRAVAACYGWPSEDAQDAEALVAHLAARNAEVATRADYRPFRGPPSRPTR